MPSFFSDHCAGPMETTPVTDRTLSSQVHCCSTERGTLTPSRSWDHSDVQVHVPSGGLLSLWKYAQPAIGSVMTMSPIKILLVLLSVIFSHVFFLSRSLRFSTGARDWGGFSALEQKGT